MQHGVINQSRVPDFYRQGSQCLVLDLINRSQRTVIHNFDVIDFRPGNGLDQIHHRLPQHYGLTLSLPEQLRCPGKRMP